MVKDNSGKTPLRTDNSGRLPPKPSINSGRGASAPPPPPPKVSQRVSTPPPPPKEALRRTPSPPPLPLDIEDGEDASELTNPRFRFTKEQQELIALIKAMHGNEGRFERNGNGLPALMAHLHKVSDDASIRIDARTTFLFVIPLKYVVIAATALALGSAGAAAHLWHSRAELEQKVESQEKKLEVLKEQLKKQEAKKTPKTSAFVPRALGNPPQKPNLKLIAKRPMRRRT